MNIPPPKEQGLTMIYCEHCETLYYDFDRPKRWELFCCYCGGALLQFGKEIKEARE